MKIKITAYNQDDKLLEREYDTKNMIEELATMEENLTLFMEDAQTIMEETADNLAVRTFSGATFDNE